MSPRTGRRPGDADTRGAILSAARQQFTEHGFERATMRGIARAAAVDPALIHHYFGDKVTLFGVAMEMPADPHVLVARMVEGPIETLGERIVRAFVAVWLGPGGSQIVALLRSATTNEQAARMLREFMTAVLLKGIASRLEVENPELRAGLCASQIVGVGLLRLVLAFEPLVQADEEELVAWLAPTLQRYLTAPLPSSPA